MEVDSKGETDMSKSNVKPTLRVRSVKDTSLQGEGSCKVAECGCQAFVAAPGGSGTHCIGRNAAGGTCNHSKDEHNE